MNNIIEKITNRAVDKAMDKVEEAIDEIDKNPYGFIHKRHPITYDGQKGYLVWDYIIWNELTFENASTHEKMSLFSSISDRETENKFNELVELYG